VRAVKWPWRARRDSTPTLESSPMPIQLSYERCGARLPDLADRAHPAPGVGSKHHQTPQPAQARSVAVMEKSILEMA